MSVAFSERPRPVSAPALIASLGFLIREPFETYHSKSKENLSSHQLTEFRECPALYRKRQLGLIPDDDRPAFVIGRAAHTLILEGREEYKRRYATGGPMNPSTGRPYDGRSKAFAEWAEQQGRPVLTESQAVLVEELARSVLKHEVATDLLADGVPEGVIRTAYRGVPCQARLDWLNPRHGIIDLKSCDNLRFLEVDARNYGYLHQLAFYRSLVAAQIGLMLPVYLIAVEKREPYRCGVWRVASEVLDFAQSDNEEAIERLKVARIDNLWHTGYESLRFYDRV